MPTIVEAAKRSARNAPKSSKQDLRTWIDLLRAAGEVQDINGAEREAEIGGIVDLYMRKMGNRAVLFDDIPGYPHGHRILANILTSVRRINLTLGLPIDGSAVELVSYWRKYMKEARSVAPVTVKSGPLMENVSSGKDVNIESIPTPRWHEHDGGYYIGTGCMVIMKDPDTGWINYYGQFYRTRLCPTLRRIDVYVIRWARRCHNRERSVCRRRPAPQHTTCCHHGAACFDLAWPGIRGYPKSGYPSLYPRAPQRCSTGDGTDDAVIACGLPCDSPVGGHAYAVADVTTP